MDNVIAINRNKRVNWLTGILIVVFHGMAIWALFNFSWANLAAFVVTWWIANSLGIGIGFHRLMTHRGFKTPRWVERTLVVFGSLALQGSALAWVTTHRMHHKFTETDKDPHSPRQGGFWSHMGWIFVGTSQWHSKATVQKYVPDLLKDNFIVRVSALYWVTSVIAGGVLLAIGGWQMVLWGVFLRTVFGWHTTWLVNSATHMWGTRRFDIHDDSTNNGLIALITFGEGWHNNHHAHPSAARHGLTWYEIDFNWMAIKVMEKLGWASNIKLIDLDKEMAKEEMAMRRAA
jgi:stearoyl-CoA desaturase (delta-9 desaturase)